MADKWADYLISAARYNTAETHIEAVRTHEDKGDTVGGPFDLKRAQVVERMRKGQTFMTIYKSTDRKWKCGALVETVVIDGVTFIRTDPDKTKADNLGALPRY